MDHCSMIINFQWHSFLRLNAVLFSWPIADSCCPTVEISTSGGPSNATQAVRMGVYHRHHFNASFSSRPIYVHSARQEFLFYVDGRSRGLWDAIQ